MAKLEKSKTQSNKKQKAKKRKHMTEETEDEVASKSLIVESDSTLLATHSTQVSTTENHFKRKSKIKRTEKEKRAKLSLADEEAKDNEAPEDLANENMEVDDLHEPTLEEIQESEKIENKKAVVTIRQKKKQKHLKRMENLKNQSVDKEKQRNEDYLQKWKHNRAEWKFEKLRQISIQHLMFDEMKLDEHIWPLALEYLAGSKGTAKDTITKLAVAVIDELDSQCEKVEDDAERQAILNSTRYQRARQLLQSFN